MNSVSAVASSPLPVSRSSVVGPAVAHRDSLGTPPTGIVQLCLDPYDLELEMSLRSKLSATLRSGSVSQSPGPSSMEVSPSLSCRSGVFQGRAFSLPVSEVAPFRSRRSSGISFGDSTAEDRTSSVNRRQSAPWLTPRSSLDIIAEGEAHALGLRRHSQLEGGAHGALPTYQTSRGALVVAKRLSGTDSMLSLGRAVSNRDNEIAFMQDLQMAAPEACSLLVHSVLVADKIVMPLEIGGDLSQAKDKILSFLHDGTKSCPQKSLLLLHLFSGVLKSVTQLHRLGWAHRDLKPANFFLSSHGTPRLGDFGSVKRIAEFESGIGGTTPKYRAPECLHAEGPLDGVKVDTFSVGLTLASILGVEPADVSENDNSEISFSNRLSEKVAGVLQDMGFSLEASVPRWVIGCIAEAASLNPSDRPSLAFMRAACTNFYSEVAFLFPVAASGMREERGLLFATQGTPSSPNSIEEACLFGDSCVSMDSSQEF